MPGDRWFYKSLEECMQALGPAAYGPPDGERYCNGTWDKILCWPATRANTTYRKHCPPIRGLDVSKFGYKRCGEYGEWENQAPGTYSSVGWTNYTDCYTKDAREIYDKFFSKTSPQVMKELAHGARIMEMTGLCLSLLAIALSLFIFCYFRSLRCDRTRIHKNLFVAIIIHVAILLIVQTDQLVAKTTGEELAGVVVKAHGTIYGTRVLCEVLYTLVEYTKTVMFMWMFLEGLYLHNMLVVSVFTSQPKYWLYYLTGWGSPVLLTCAWAITNGILDTEQCWFGYTFKPLFWILEGPRAAVIVVNFIFLLNIVRVLVTKLRESNSTEAVQVRKAVKAAIVLLPLLGANNFMAFVEPPMDGVVKFGVWTYTSTFLISFQGFFISLLYCFVNSEVQNTVRHHWKRYRQSRGGYISGQQRMSRTMSMFTAVSEVPNTGRLSERVPLSGMNGHTPPQWPDGEWLDNKPDSPGTDWPPEPGNTCKDKAKGDDNDNCVIGQ